MPIMWMGSKPTKCDLCHDPLVYFFVDGKLRQQHGGMWALMCRLCHEEKGVGIGVGRGQVYNLETLVKVEG